MRRWISDPNKASAQQTIGSDRPGYCESNGISPGSNISVPEAGNSGVAGRAIAKVPEAIGNRASGAIGEGDHQGPGAVCRAAGEGRHWSLYSNAS